MWASVVKRVKRSWLCCPVGIPIVGIDKSNAVGKSERVKSIFS